MSKEKDITYAEAILEKYKTHSFRLFKVKRKIVPLIQEFAGSGLADTIEMGSVLQGTDVKRGENDLDLDIMISLHHDIKYTLKEVHIKLFDFLKKKGLKPEKRNISIKVVIDKVGIDLVPAKTVPGSTDHVVYSRKGDYEMTSNPKLHVKIIKASGQHNTIRLAKLWIYLHNLELESFLLALICVEALKDKLPNTLEENFKTVLQYLADKLRYVNIADPACTKDHLDRHMTDSEKKLVADKAKKHLNKPIDEILT